MLRSADQNEFFCPWRDRQEHEERRLHQLPTLSTLPQGKLSAPVLSVTCVLVAWFAAGRRSTRPRSSQCALLVMAFTSGSLFEFVPRMRLGTPISRVGNQSSSSRICTRGNSTTLLTLAGTWLWMVMLCRSNVEPALSVSSNICEICTYTTRIQF